MRDQKIIYFAAFLRALATGMMGVLLGIYLTKLTMDVSKIGWIVSAGLFGAAFATLTATLWGDHFGRRRFLVLLSTIGALGGLASSLASEFHIRRFGVAKGQKTGIRIISVN